MKAFEDATGETLDETKKEIASEELIITGGLGEDIGADKATGIVNDIKTEIIKNNTQDTIQIAETINNVVNNYNVTINAEQQQQLEELMKKISAQDYNYKEMKNTLSGIKDTVEEKLEEIGEEIDKGFFENMFNNISGWFTGFGEWISGLLTSKEEELGILGTTNDALLGENAVIDSTNKDAINLPTEEEVQGLFVKMWNWFKEVFNKQNSNENTTNEIDNAVNILEENSTIEENIKVDSLNQEENSIIEEDIEINSSNIEETANDILDNEIHIEN